MTNFNDRRFMISHLFIPVLVMLPILLAFEFTNWDVDFQQFFYMGDRTWLVSHKSGWIETYLHDKSKTITQAYAYICAIIFLLSFRVQRFKAIRQDVLFVLVAVALSTGLVSFLKHATYIDCPINLTIFGGQDIYVKIFETRIAGQKKSICWPAGHASAGFAFMTAYFVARRWWPRYSVPTLIGGIGLGLLYGGVRIVQGQHFLSHVLWSGIICWVVIVVVAMVIFREKTVVNSHPPLLTPADPKP